MSSLSNVAITITLLSALETRISICGTLNARLFYTNTSFALLSSTKTTTNSNVY